jgi:hypothetical protein
MVLSEKKRRSAIYPFFAATSLPRNTDNGKRCVLFESLSPFLFCLWAARVEVRSACVSRNLQFFRRKISNVALVGGFGGENTRFSEFNSFCFQITMKPNILDDSKLLLPTDARTHKRTEESTSSLAFKIYVISTMTFLWTGYTLLGMIN